MSCYFQRCPRSETWICRVCPGPTWPHTAQEGSPNLGVESRTGQGHGELIPSVFILALGGLKSSLLPQSPGPGQPRFLWVRTCVLCGGCCPPGQGEGAGHGACWPEPQGPYTHQHTLLQRPVSIQLPCGHRGQRIPGMCRALGQLTPCCPGSVLAVPVIAQRGA